MILTVSRHSVSTSQDQQVKDLLSIM